MSTPEHQPTASQPDVSPATQRVTRRTALKAAAAATVGPWIVRGPIFGANAPSERITVGCIGTGNQGMPIMKRFMATPGVQVVAVCDVNRGSYGYREPEHFYGREPAQKAVDEFYAKERGKGSYKGCTAYNNFRDLIARDDIDAVSVVTPDHWHAIMTVLACRAGKDVYCEKPLSLTIADGREIVDAARKYDRIVQTGTHERSNPITQFVCEAVRNGAVGEVKRVITNVGYNNKVGPGPGWQPMPVPEGFDYDRWLGPAPKVPYHEDRCLYRFRFNYDYSGGQVTNFGAHSNDMAQWALGMDGSGPAEVQYLDAKFLPEGSLFTTATETKYRCRYTNGVELICVTGKPSVQARFEGTDGWIETGYGATRASRPELLEGLPEKDRRNASLLHVGDFVEAVRNRTTPRAPAEVGHHAVNVCHLGNIAIRLNQQTGYAEPLEWDPAAERFVGAPKEASAFLSRERRKGWDWI